MFNVPVYIRRLSILYEEPELEPEPQQNDTAPQPCMQEFTLTSALSQYMFFTAHIFLDIVQSDISIVTISALYIWYIARYCSI